MPRNRSQGQSIESSLISLFASLFFSIPTAAFIWFWANSELAVYWDGFLNSRYLISCIIVFAVLALLPPPKNIALPSIRYADLALYDRVVGLLCGGLHRYKANKYRTQLQQAPNDCAVPLWH